MPRRLRSLVLLISLTTIACEGSNDSAGAEASVTAEAPQPGVQANPASPPSDARLAGPMVLTKAVPADAGGVVVVRTGDSLFSAATRLAWLGPRDAAQYAAMTAEVDAYMRDRIGVVLTGTSTVTAFFADNPERYGLILDNVEGEVSGPEHSRHGDTPLRALDGSQEFFSAKRGSTLLLGNAAGIAAMLDGLDGKLPALVDEGEGLAKLLAKHSAGAGFALVTELTKLPSDIAKPAASMGLERGYLGFSNGGIRLIAYGTPEGVKAAEGMVNAGLAEAQGELEKLKLQATRDDDMFVGLGTIVGTYTGKRLAMALTPKVDGNTLTIEVPVALGDSSTVAAIMGLGAVIAVPALQKYMLKSKTSEAKTQLAKLFDGTSAYFTAEQVQRGDADSGAVHQCPNDGRAQGESGITPPLSVNCNEGPAGRCMPSEGGGGGEGSYDIAVWTGNPVWNALNFMQEQGHYYHYNVIWNNEPAGFEGCQFTVQAFADLDDDGVYSTFERSGAGDAQGVEAAVGLYVNNELE